MLPDSNSSFSAEVSEFLLNCFVRSPKWQLWLSLPLSFLFLLAMGANATLLITIWLEKSLHEPMYYLLSLLSLLDMVLCLTVIPKVLAIFWFDLRSISFSACFLQMFIMNNFLPMESCTFLAMAHDRYVAICKPLHYPSIITDQFVAKAIVFILIRNTFLTAPIPITHMAKKKVSPDIPVLLNILHHVIPAALNPIVYGVRTQEIKQGIWKLLRRSW
ncbi:PREDICTED: olfactory receptor 56A3 [Myotis davidii]|uniref:Olfactory receptor 56A3 n=1 Tax=Myotis davidii TaxID=225400 RepID=L5LHN7_MYODS|nr:PREDICTED: olfactory receptor 56A3 [Myotis davidii]ELK25416.1 Olfactory receptor 56A3 [Myotis davidii]